MMGQAAQEHGKEVARLLGDNSDNVRASACLALGRMNATDMAKEVAKCVEDKFPSVVSGAITALAMFDEEGKRFEQEVAQKLGDQSKEVKSAALVYFTTFEDLAIKHSDRICKLLADEESYIRECV